LLQRSSRFEGAISGRRSLSFKGVLPCCCVLVFCLPTWADGFQGEGSSSFPPPQVVEVSHRVSRQIEQLTQLWELQEYEEVLERTLKLLEVAVVPGRPLERTLRQEGAVAVADGRYRSLLEYCQRQLAQLPAEQLAQYRQQVDPIAETWYARGIANRDERLLRKLVDRMFLSSWGDRGLLVLGEMALERADTQQARIDWTRIGAKWPATIGSSPQLRLPSGLLIYPDTKLEQAMLWARLALVSIRAHEFARGQLEINQLRKMFPLAQGNLAGQSGNYVNRLTQLLESARGEVQAAMVSETTKKNLPTPFLQEKCDFWYSLIGVLRSQISNYIPHFLIRM